MIEIMSYQYSPLQEGSEIGVSQVGYMGSHLTPTTSAPECNQINPARRRGSPPRELKLKRSVSTPNVRPQETNETSHEPLGLPNEKRRNRLGYHRTPTACSHCRRRKIRCKQPETPDVLGRCESCINLNRDCVYTAVNQLSPPATAQRPGRTSVGSSIASPSTSPLMPAGHVVEGQSNPVYHQLATISSMSNIGQQSVEPGEEEGYSTENRIASNTPIGRTFNYGHETNGWLATGAGASTSKTPGDPNTPWANFGQGMPETTGLSPYPTSPPPPPMSTWPASSLGLSRIDTDTRLDDTWKPYSSGARPIPPDDTQSRHFIPPSTRTYDRMQPSIATNFVPEASLGVHESLSAGATPHLAYGVWQQSYQYAKSNEDYGGWYEDRGQHPPEGHVSPAGEDPHRGGDIYYGQR